MCILLKFDSAKFGVSKVIEEKPFGGRLQQPGKGRFNIPKRISVSTYRLIASACKIDCFSI